MNLVLELAPDEIKIGELFQFESANKYLDKVHQIEKIRRGETF